MRLNWYSAQQILDMIRRKDVRIQEVVESTLDAIKSVEPKVNAYIKVDEEGALKKAAELDELLAKNGDIGPLGGLPIAIKDNMVIQGEETTCASKILRGFYSPYNAAVIEKLKESGAIFLGKTNLDEFAMGSSTENSAVKLTRNPWDIQRIPGGSSGGSAAAVVAREAFGALGSDTGGSIRQPASFCGAVGIKPTYGRVSRYGLVAFASSLDQIGCFARDMWDLALILNVIAGYDKRDSTSVNIPVPDYTKSLTGDIKGLRIGLPKEYFTGGIDPEVEKAVKEAVKTIGKLGAEIVEISLPHTEYAIATYYIICTAEASSNLARYEGVQYGYRVGSPQNLIDMYNRTRDEGFGDEVKRRIILGTYVLSAGYYDAYYLKALKVRTLIKQDFDNAFKNVDCIATPVSPTTAFKIGEKTDDALTMYLSDIYTISINLAGIPGLSIPCGFDSKGLPIGLQLLGKHFGEETILNIGYAYQQATDYHKQMPAIVKEFAKA